MNSRTLSLSSAPGLMPVAEDAVVGLRGPPSEADRRRKKKKNESGEPPPKGKVLSPSQLPLQPRPTSLTLRTSALPAEDESESGRIKKEESKKGAQEEEEEEAGRTQSKSNSKLASKVRGIFSLRKTKRKGAKAKTRKVKKRLQSPGAASIVLEQPQSQSSSHDDILDKEDSVIDLREDEMREKEEEEEGAKSRLFKIVAEDKIEREKVQKREDAEEYERKRIQEEEEEEEKAGLFARGSSNLMNSVRNSLRKIKGLRRNNNKPSQNSNGEGGINNANEVTLSDVADAKVRNRKGRRSPAKGDQKKDGKKTGGGLLSPKGGECNDSQDSGLGEDSDFFDPTLSTCSPRSTTPGTTSGFQSQSSSGIIRPPSSNLRKVSSTSSKESATAVTFASTLGGKKHVLIREPSLIHLPSGQRRLQTGVCAGIVSTRIRRLETVQIYSKPTRVPVMADRTLSVSSQWGALYQGAYAEVLRCVHGCDPFSARIVFNPSVREVRADIEALDDVSTLIHTVYRVLFYEWLKRGRTSHLSIVLHCVQSMLVVVVEVAGFGEEGRDDEGERDRLRLRRTCRDLKRSCEASRYQPLGACLDHTRRVYIDLWCTLLCVPFSGSASSETSSSPPRLPEQLRRRVNENTAILIKQQ